MRKTSNILTLLLGLTFFVSCVKNVKSDPADKFLKFLNNYQADSLQILVTDDFKLKRTYTNHTSDKKSFIDQYVPTSKNFNGKYIVLTTNRHDLETEFLVEDQSDYFKYLNVDYPKWKIIVTRTNQDKITAVTIDTIKSYKAYLSQIKQKSEDFESWLKTNYPDETNNRLYSTTGLLTKRLKEYAAKHSR